MWCWGSIRFEYGLPGCRCYCCWLVLLCAAAAAAASAGIAAQCCMFVVYLFRLHFPLHTRRIYFCVCVWLSVCSAPLCLTTRRGYFSCSLIFPLLARALSHSIENLCHTHIHRSLAHSIEIIQKTVLYCSQLY